MSIPTEVSAGSSESLGKMQQFSTVNQIIKSKLSGKTAMNILVINEINCLTTEAVEGHA